MNRNYSLLKMSPFNFYNILIQITYNPPLFIQCIQSILAQSYKNYKIYVCYEDDRCVEFLKFYPQIHSIKICRKNNKSPSHCYNHLLNKATDGWILFLNCDMIFAVSQALYYINKYTISDQDILFWKVKLGSDELVPNIHDVNPGEIHSTGYCFHSKFKNKSNWKNGDYITGLLKDQFLIRRFIPRILVQSILKELPPINILSNNNKVFIINNNLAGGSYKWLKDIEKLINITKITNLNELNNILFNCINSKNIIILINSLLHMDITIQDILNLHNKYKFKIILPIHDVYWLSNPSNTYNFKIHNIYLTQNLKSSIQPIITKFINICSKIIFPSKFIFDIYNNNLNLNLNNVIQHNWIDYNVNIKFNYDFMPLDNIINIGVLVEPSETKGEEQINYLIKKYYNFKKYKINILRTGFEIPYYEDNIESFLNHIQIYKIHGLFLLNKWGETWCYALTKYLISGLPILYNNIGSFKERIPKNIDKYIINNNNESEYYNFNKLDNNFKKLLTYIIKNKGSYYNNNKIKSTIDKNSLIQVILHTNNIKKYAVYFPQFHEILENNINYYDKYTDIINLKNLNYSKKETPNLELLNLKSINDYDLKSNDILIHTQLDLLKQYNIDGFAMYYYWFSTNTITNKKRIMYDIHEKFLNINMRDKKIFFIWANENWSDNPAFSNNNHKITNEYNDIEEHCSELIATFKNNNYLKINNRPIFYIHHPWEMSEKNINKFKDRLHNLCLNNGFNGIDFRINSMNSLSEDIIKNKSFYYEFHPNYKKTKSVFVDNNGQIKLDYEKYVNEEIGLNCDVTTIFFDFDNRARLSNPNRLNKSTICINNSKKNHMKYVNKIKDSDTQILLINAWNEWGEKMHIEPSNLLGNYYLDLLRNI